MSDIVLFWHRRDLRICDNVGLAEANKLSSRVAGVFCFDPDILKRDDIAPARIVYMIGCLQKLQQAYTQAHSQLLILHERPSVAIPKLAAALQAKAVVWNHDVEPFARERDRATIEALHQQGIAAHSYWDQLLHDPKDIMTGASSPYTVYTPFWKNWCRRQKEKPYPQLQVASGLTALEQQTASSTGIIDLPSAEDLGFVWDAPLPIEPGEAAAIEQLESFCDRAIFDYSEQRNFPAMPGTSGLSAALRFGAIGVRTVWAATQLAEQACRSDEAHDGVRTWQQELAWREFYQYVMYFFPELADGPYRSQWRNFPWSDNQTYFQAWCEGRTGYPIVDAAMRQLNETGWMHNRCRMIVASFLTKDLLINWQWGEKYFMQKLVDGDLSANNGGWQWSASSGMDPKPLRVFNPTTQARKFDADGEYIRQWVPELRSLDTGDLMSGNIPPLVRQGLDYPEPIVDHQEQQRRFKALYEVQKQR